jgi:dihydrofolate synthase/folylpolyglutamate synthase
MRGARLSARGRDWTIAPGAEGLRFADAAGVLALPWPSLAGAHQHDNAGIAVAGLRAAGLGIPASAFAQGVARAEWPGRMQRLGGRLAATLPEAWELWLDGAHNPGAGAALAGHLAGWADRPLHLVVGMKKGKDAAEFLGPLLPFAKSVWAVAEPDQYLALPVPEVIAASGGVARAGGTVAEALARLVASQASAPARVLVCGSLYLAGALLRRQ